jgi:serine/threonine protein phosphatase 1
LHGFFTRLRGDRNGAAAPAFTRGARMYCIGDIHGRADLLEQLQALIRADSAAWEGRKKVLYLGDYIDRGPDSQQVIDRLLYEPLPGFEQICLLGNHEQALLDFLEYPDHAAGWLGFGGLATLLSYGVRLERPPAASDPVTLSEALRRKLPPAHLDFFNGLARFHQEGSYAFVHAGVRPGIPLEEQAPDDLLWIREEFTRHASPHEYIIVHGHSITEQAELLPNRIGIDTGAFHTGVLTCLVLEGSGQRLLQTGPGPDPGLPGPGGAAGSRPW